MGHQATLPDQHLDLKRRCAVGIRAGETAQIVAAVRKAMARELGRRGVPETGRLSCCAFVLVDQAAEDIAAVDLLGGWRSRDGLAL
jgi:hypothetical protein